MRVVKDGLPAPYGIVEESKGTDSTAADRDGLSLSQWCTISIIERNDSDEEQAPH